RKIEVDPTPTPTMVASAGTPAKATPTAPAAKAAASATAKPAAAKAKETEQVVAKAASTEEDGIRQTEAVDTDTASAKVQNAGFAKLEDEKPDSDEAVPADWSDGGWKGHSLTDKCQDACADILREVAKLEDTADATRK